MEVLGLHERQELLEEAAVLLNSQWPRSLEARKHSIMESNDGLPLSLVLINNSGRVIGFVRVLSAATEGGALVESLVVAADMRGRGLGRKLMNEAETRAKKLGFGSIHLSTHDQHDFYRHIGYILGQSVNAVRKCTNKIPAATIYESQSEDSISNNEKQCELEMDPPTLVAPPPPAPPPPPPPLLKIENNVDIKWYIKHLK